MSFVRSSKVTTKAVVPVLLAGLLATGIVFIEVSPANAAACSTTGATTAYAGGAGTSGDPYLLATAEQLALLSATAADRSKHFKQTANISLEAGCTWTPIGSSSSFNGTYDGGGFTVSGMKTTNHDGARTGLIALLDTGGTLKNVGAVDVDFVGKYHVGGLVGESYGTIQNSYATGQIVGKVQTGGLVGTYRGGSISNSYARTSVSYNSENPNANNSVEPYRAGGLVGATVGSPGTISYSWSSGLVTTPAAGVTYYIGGVFGGVSSGSTPTFNKVRWDTETSTQLTNAAGSGHVGNSTAQMQTLATYTTDDYDIRSGWEAFNFSTPTNFWGICSSVNDGYPFLLWEYSSNPCLSAPTAPSITSIAPASSSGTLSVAFTAPTSDGGAVISNYKYSIDNGATWVTRSPSATTSPLVIQGLNNGTSYQIKLLAINSVGEGAASSAVSGTPLTSASAPTITAITASSGALSVAFTAPSSNGGATLSNYKYSLDNGATWITRSTASTSSPLVITGLTNGTSYQLKLLAINSQGDGAASSAVSGTPVAPSPTTSAAPATTPASLTAPAATLAVTGSNLLINWGFVWATIVIGLALVLISGARRREPGQGNS